MKKLTEKRLEHIENWAGGCDQVVKNELCREIRRLWVEKEEHIAGLKLLLELKEEVKELRKDNVFALEKIKKLGG